MPGVSDMTLSDISGTPVSATLVTHGGALGTLRALARRLAPSRDGYPISFDGVVSRHEAGFAVEGYPVRSRRAPVESSPARARAEAVSAARLRANARAAYSSVVGTHEQALDAALAVIEAELVAVRARCDAHAEALKSIRLYATDAETRALAARGLDACAEVLACRAATEAGCPRAAEAGEDGRD
ncbi:hypothetical protein [Amaricoccus sp.]|uniref:hypothetical protein n=1 Tax=Amaricoccus sp. TaxID=1872485 RepID=UPI002635E7FC|nr:hypothetical protein [uncultured Amaricoccus sp.]